MIKILGQTGLNFIGNKYKELKKLVDKKVDGVDGKQLSTNDYTNEAKKKVDAIPTNPKYTDTVTSVVDNLTTDDGTKALSAKQGKALQDGKADKSNISRCKARGYNTSNIWTNLDTERDLEDWIGDFDKRTRELKSGGGAKLSTTTKFGAHPNGSSVNWTYLKIGNIAIVNYTADDSANSMNSTWNLPSDCRPKQDVRISLAGVDMRDGGVASVHFTIKTDGSLDIPRFTSTPPVLGSFTIMYECA